MSSRPTWYRLLSLLAPGCWVGGQRLADELGLSRTAVWKQVEKLRGSGLPVEADKARGYRLAWPVKLLDAGQLGSEAAACGLELEIHPELDSTSGYLSRLPIDDRHARVVIAEYQISGRGRRERRWQSPPSSGLYFSLGWRFECGMLQLGALSLVVGLAAAQAVKAAYGLDIALKWPNDLVHEGRKLGGCLVEIGGNADGPCIAVIGIGINARMPASFDPGQPWTDLWRARGDHDRDRLAAALFASLPPMLRRLEAQGFDVFQPEWSEHDALDGQRLRLSMPDGAAQTGVARGVSERGGLYLESGGKTRELLMGEVTVRGA